MIIFCEVQYMRRVWRVLLLVLGTTALMWWGFFQQIILGVPWGNNPSSDRIMWLLWLIFGIGFPLFFYWLRLIVEVSEDSILINYVPLTKTSILIADLQEAEARTYKPLQEYGGWGIRRRSNRRAYNVSGNRGVELTLHNGRKIMIGSQKAEELALAINSQMSK